MREWYEEHEKHISTFSLLGGFLFDSLTLKRIDSPIDDVWLLVNLLSIAICVLYLHNRESREGKESWRHFWLFNIMQFSIGALLGASFIFYFRSSVIVGSWPFLLVLLLAMFANEYLHKKYSRLTFNISFFFLSTFIFAIFIIPILTNHIGPWIFLLSGLVSLLVLGIFLFFLKRVAKEKFKKSFNPVWQSVGVIFVALNILYFTNLIPPIPLSLKDAGIYQSITHEADGTYTLVGRKRNWFSQYLNMKQTIHWTPGTSLSAYTAIFAPGTLSTQIVHEWQHRDAGKWTTATRIPLQLSGGRDRGFRTFSTKSNLSPGDWRVNVETPRGQLLGRISFKVI